MNGWTGIKISFGETCNVFSIVRKHYCIIAMTNQVASSICLHSQLLCYRSNFKHYPCLISIIILWKSLIYSYWHFPYSSNHPMDADFRWPEKSSGRGLGEVWPTLKGKTENSGCVLWLTYHKLKNTHLWCDGGSLCLNISHETGETLYLN